MPHCERCKKDIHRSFRDSHYKHIKKCEKHTKKTNKYDFETLTDEDIEKIFSKLFNNVVNVVNIANVINLNDD
jgi:acetyl-CoA carboxylase beta subunit